MCSESVSNSCSACDKRRVSVKGHAHYLIWGHQYTQINANKIKSMNLPENKWENGEPNNVLTRKAQHSGIARFCFIHHACTTSFLECRGLRMQLSQKERQYIMGQVYGAQHHLKQSVILQSCVLLVRETRENHRPIASQ